MKIYFLFYLFFSSLDRSLSSPIKKRDVDAYNKDVAKLESSMKAMMPKMDDYLSKMNLVLKKQEGKREDKSVTTTKSIENKERIAEAYTSSSEKNDKKSLDNATSDQRKDVFDEAKINENFIQLARNSCHHIQAAVFNIIPKSYEKLVKRGIEIHSNRIPVRISNNKNTSNEQASNKESQVNSVQKKIPDNGTYNVISNAEALDQNSNKVTTKLSQENKGIFINLSSGLINQNKSSIIDFNSGNEMLQIRNSENFEMQKSDRNAENANNNKERDTDNATALTTSKAEVTNPQENKNMTNKTFSSTEEISVKYQKNVNSKVKLTPPTVVSVNENEIDVMGSEKSETENPTKKEENSSMTSSTDYDKQHKNGPTKETAETLEKIIFWENNQVATEKKVMNHSLSTGKLNDSSTKSKKVAVKLNDFNAKSLEAGTKLNESGAIPPKTDVKLNDSGTKSKKLDAKLNDSGAKSLAAGTKLIESGAILPKTDAKLNDSGTKSEKLDTKLNDSGAKSLEAGAKLNESGAIPPKIDARLNDSGTKSKKLYAKLNDSGAESLKDGAKLNESGAVSPKADVKLNDSGAKSLEAEAKLNESSAIPPKTDAKLNDSGPKSKKLYAKLNDSDSKSLKVGAKLNESGAESLKDGAKLNELGAVSPKADAKLNDSGAKSLEAGAKLNESSAIPPKTDAKLNDSGPKSKKVDDKLNDSGSKSLKVGAKLNESGAVSPIADAKLNDSDAKSSKNDKKQSEKVSPTISDFN